jgi:hypothetical protein
MTTGYGKKNLPIRPVEKFKVQLMLEIYFYPVDGHYQ